MISRTIITTFALILSALMLVGCHGGNEDVAATVAGHKLLRSEVAAIVPEGTSQEDSAALAAQYIEQWIDQMVIISKAEKNVTVDFSKQMELYRNSLLVHAYEQQIVEQNIDTAVSNSEIEEYYNSHPNDFLLASPIVKIVYFKLKPTTPVKVQQRVKTMMMADTLKDEDIVKLQQTAAPHSVEFSMDYDQWVALGDLRGKMPETVFSNPSYLRYHRFIQQSDSTGISLVRLFGYKITSERAPIEVERDNIKTIIINRRRVDFIARMRQDLRREAEENGKIERF